MSLTINGGTTITGGFTAWSSFQAENGIINYNEGPISFETGTSTNNGTTGFTVIDSTLSGVWVGNLTPNNLTYFINLGIGYYGMSTGPGSTYAEVGVQIVNISPLIFFIDPGLTYPVTLNFPLYIRPVPSDRRLKRNITFLETRNDIKIYSFQYLWSEEYFVGVMAQDLLGTKYELAVGEHNGHYTVDYSKLGFNMQLLSQYNTTTV